MEYTILGILLMILMLLYFKIADRYNIIDKPNHRSAHTEITLRGGGIIFWFSALLYFIQHTQSNSFFFVGITLVSLVSFWDDIQCLSNKIRILTHFGAMSLIFYQLNVFGLVPWWGIIIAYVMGIGIINAYNFMDGINGITGLYTLTVMGAFLYVNQYVIAFVDLNLIIYPIIASVVFLFFNYREKAKCFAGDVGSIAIAFWVIYLLLLLVLKSNTIVWILFLAVYGVDAVCTIMHRLYLRQNIFEAHRLHFYQILSNEYKLPHRIVSVFYAVLQLIVSYLVVTLFNKMAVVTIFASILIPLIALYLLKFYFLDKIKKQQFEASGNN